MITVNLYHLKFHAYHGVHAFEKKLGNDFMIDASVEFYEAGAVITSIEDTIDYTSLYDIIKTNMSRPEKLLETVVMNISNEIAEKYPLIKSVNVSLKKLHPPIEGMEGSVGVKYHKEY